MSTKRASRGAPGSGQGAVRRTDAGAQGDLGPGSGGRGADTGGPTADATEQTHSQGPLGWPRPSRATLVLMAVWLVGLVVALAVPATIVPPNERSPAGAELWAAFGASALGAGIMLTVAGLLYRRTRDASALVYGAVPAVSVILGGLILVATKGFDSNSFSGS